MQFSYTNRWSVQCCHECHAWLPDMDLRLAPAPGAIHRNHTPNGETFWMLERFKAAASGTNPRRVYQNGRFVGIAS